MNKTNEPKQTIAILHFDAKTEKTTNANEGQLEVSQIDRDSDEYVTIYMSNPNYPEDDSCHYLILHQSVIDTLRNI